MVILQEIAGNDKTLSRPTLAQIFCHRKQQQREAITCLCVLLFFGK